MLDGDLTKLSDIELLALCGWMEARGNGISGCYLVMHVIINRVGHPGFPKTIQAVILQPGAFSWTEPNDPEHNTRPKDGDPIGIACLADSPNVIGRDSDPTNGSHFYANLQTMDKNGWFAKHIISDTINHPHTLTYEQHDFYV